MKLNYDDWFDQHCDELNIKFAETGADREMDFDLERELEKEYLKYMNETCEEEANTMK